jgi:hypothetical protein
MHAASFADALLRVAGSGSFELPSIQKTKHSPCARIAGHVKLRKSRGVGVEERFC